MPNCSRAMRITSVVLSVLLTASVLAWRKHYGNIYLFVCYINGVINYPLKDRLGDQTIFIFVLIEAIKIWEERRESYICTISNILSKYLQRNRLGVVLLFSLSYPAECGKKKTGERGQCLCKKKDTDQTLRYEECMNFYSGSYKFIS